MYNYNMTISGSFFATLKSVDELFKTQAARSVEVGAVIRGLEEKIQTELKAETPDVSAIAAWTVEKDATADAWKAENKGYNDTLFGNKKAGTAGLCDDITKDFYDAYKAYMDGNRAPLADCVRSFLWKHTVDADTIKDRAVKEFTAQLLLMIGGRFASAKKITEGSRYIVGMNQKAFKKYLFGAIIDVVNNSTIRVEKKAIAC